MMNDVERQKSEPSVELPKTVEAAEEAFDRLRHTSDKLAIEKGSSPELAEALATELSMFDRLEQMRANAEGGKAMLDYEKYSDAERMSALELGEYAAGRAELSEDAQSEMELRVATLNAALDRLGDDFDHSTITELRGATDPMELHRFEQEYRELAELRNGPLEAELPQPEVTQELDDPKNADKEAAFNEAYENSGLEGALDRDPGMYGDRKGAALAVEVMKDLGMSAAEMADYAKYITEKYNHFTELAKTIHPDKSAQTQGRWAENQLWQMLDKDPVWQRLEQKIDEYGDTLAGKGSRISKNKVMSSYLLFAQTIK